MAADLDPTGEGALGPSRRTTLKKGIAVGGAALWAVPAVQALAVTSASAQATSVITPPPPPPPSEPVGKIISHGFLLLVCGGLYYGVQIDEKLKLGSLGQPDKKYLVDLSSTDDLTSTGQVLNPDASMLASFGSGRVVFEGENALFITVSSRCEAIAAAVSFDGSFQNQGDPSKYGPATIVGRTAYFRESDDV